MKSEPGEYSIADLERDGRTHWDGVRNYEARNLLRDTVRVGDTVVFYHSNAKPPAAAGLAEVVREGYPDHTAFDPKDPHHDPKSDPDAPTWFMVDLAFRACFARPVPIARMREEPALAAMPLLNRSRLSVQPLTADEYQIIAGLGGHV